MTSHRTTSGLFTVLSALLIANVLAAGSAAQGTASARAEARRYHGTDVKPDPRATGSDLALQARIARLMSANDFVPEARERHFEWMAESERTPITGWEGRIVTTTPDKDGTVVTVLFHVRSVRGFANLSTSTERYRFSDGKLRFLDLVYKAAASTWN